MISTAGPRQRMYDAVQSMRVGFQRARVDLFVELMRPSEQTRVLDLGGNRGQLARMLKARANCQMTVADVLDFSSDFEGTDMTFRQTPESGELPFDDDEFDIVLCNSVIEHVTLPKRDCTRRDIAPAQWYERASAAQARFAREIRRVGGGYFVQTPHPSFPIDLHLWLPFTARLSHNATLRLTAIINRFWIKEAASPDWLLIPPARMRELFPEGTLHVERFMGLPKSLIAYKAAA